jgi:hypothetical protein
MADATHMLIGISPITSGPSPYFFSLATCMGINFGK